MIALLQALLIFGCFYGLLWLAIWLYYDWRERRWKRESDKRWEKASRETLPKFSAWAESTGPSYIKEEDK